MAALALARAARANCLPARAVTSASIRTASIRGAILAAIIATNLRLALTGGARQRLPRASRQARRGGGTLSMRLSVARHDDVARRAIKIMAATRRMNLSNPQIPTVGEHRGVPLHDSQDEKRLAVVRAAISIKYSTSIARRRFCSTYVDIAEKSARK